MMKKIVFILMIFIFCITVQGQKITQLTEATTAPSTSLMFIRQGASGDLIKKITVANLLKSVATNNLTLTGLTTLEQLKISAGGVHITAITSTGSDIIFWSGANQLTAVPGIGGATWGTITGTIADQLDLLAAFNLKANLISPVFTGTPTVPGYVPTSRTVNGHALTGNVTVTASDVSLGNVTNESKATMFTSPTITGTPTIAGYVPTSRTVNGHALTGNISVTAADLSLGNVTNESKATMFANSVFTGTHTIPSPFTLGATSVTTTGAQLNKLPNMQVGIFNVLDYGADNTGTIDATTAIQNTINAAIVTGIGGVVYIPTGEYKCNGKLYITNSNGITVEGGGNGVLNYGTTLKYTGHGNFITIGDSSFVNWSNAFHFNDIAIHGVIGSKNAIRTFNTNYMSLRNLAISGFDSAAVRIKECVGGSIDNLYVHTYVGACGWGIYFDGSHNNETCINVNQPRIIGTTIAGIYANTVQQINVFGGEISSGTGYGIFLDDYAQLCTFIGIDLEKSVLGDWRIDGYGNTLLNCFSYETPGDVQINGVRNTIIGGRMDTIKLAANAYDTYIEHVGLLGINAITGNTRSMKLNNYNYANTGQSENYGVLEISQDVLTDHLNLINPDEGGTEGSPKFVNIRMGTYPSNEYGGTNIQSQSMISGGAQGKSALLFQTNPGGWSNTYTDALRLDYAGNAFTAGAINYVLDNSGGGNDTYTATETGFVFAIGKVITFHPLTLNTGACTLNINGGGAIAIKTQANGDPANSDMVATGYYSLCWNGANWVLMTK